MEKVLQIIDLEVEVKGKKILNKVNIELNKGTINALMGPNGSGKSTLALVLMGHPGYRVISGKILFKGEDITHTTPTERAKKGLFLSFQYPSEVNGVTIAHFLRTAYNALYPEKKLSVTDFHRLAKEKLALLHMPETFLDRYINYGFSGGEKKKAEILQMAILKPELAILDETDSGLDIDALKAVAESINATKSPETTILIITHYKRILDYSKPDHVFIMNKGSITFQGSADLVNHLEEKGYAWLNGVE